MKDYTEKAELYVSGLSSGNILPGSDQFTNVLRFLKSFRKYRADHPASAPLYRSLAGLSRKRLYAEIIRPLSGKFQLISKGEAHLLAGLLKQGDRTWFVKTVSSSAADEFDAMKALLDGRIPRSGRHFAFVVPDSVILNAGLVTYLSPAIADLAPLVQEFRKQPNDVLTIVRGLAEMNVSLGCFSRSACPLPLLRQAGSLNEFNQAHLNPYLESLDAPSREDFCTRLDQIRDRWPDLERRFNEAKWGLAHGDLASLNATVLDGKLVFLDLGKTGFGPLGSDLFWLLYKNRASAEGRRLIVSAYCEELGRHGVAVTEEEIYASAMTRYAQKWLFPARRGTNANIGHIQETQRAVLDLLQKSAPPAATP
jgi:hypothetical protein